MNRLLHIMSFRTFLVSVFMIGFLKAHAQKEGAVGIGTTSPHNSAILDLSSSNKGLLLPRLSLEDRTNIKEPAAGLMIYQTNFMSGLYIYDGNNWSAIGSTEAKLTTADNSVWGTSGNTGIDENLHFIGTTDEAALIFKVNNTNSGKIDSKRGNLFMGYKAGQNSNAYNSVVLGSLAMQKANQSGNNIAIGFQSMFTNEIGGHNVALGTGSLAANATGNNNVAVGSLAGYKSTGNGNVFLGFQAGYSEQESNKLIIGNDANRKALIYGDFETGKIGFNTQDLIATLNISSNNTNSSGLRFVKLNSASTTESSNGKVLTVNARGEVILAPDVAGNTVTTYWKLNGNAIENSNAGNVNIKTNLSTTGRISSNSLEIGDGGLKLPFVNQSDKILGLDASGNVIPVEKPVAQVVSGGGASGLWFQDSDGEIKPTINTNIRSAKRIGAHGFDVAWGGIRFTELDSNYPNPFPSNGLALSLDEFGNVILTKNSDGGTGSSSGGNSKWSQSGNIIFTPTDNKVAIGSNIPNLPDGYLLYVKKGILAERVRVAVSTSSKWADYVFADDYNLMPLSEVEKFIEANDHLPNVPSAEEVSNSGIDMAEMAAKQMEKIEELTLYLIDANKRIEKLEKALENK